MREEKREKDIEEFNKKLGKLLNEYKLGLGAVAFLTPDGKIAARPQLVEVTEEKTKKLQKA